MAGTLEGAKKMREASIKRFGSEEAYREWMRSIASKGGKLGRTGGFYANRELAREAGKKGGMISRRGPSKKND